MVFQSGALFDSLTVGENVGFLLYEHSDLPDDHIQARAAGPVHHGWHETVNTGWLSRCLGIPRVKRVGSGLLCPSSELGVCRRSGTSEEQCETLEAFDMLLRATTPDSRVRVRDHKDPAQL